MKVRELIGELFKLDPNEEIIIVDFNHKTYNRTFSISSNEENNYAENTSWPTTINVDLTHDCDNWQRMLDRFNEKK